jgi:hypothetical protein
METLHAPNPYFSNIFSTICSLFFVGFMGGSVSKILCCEGSICALWEEAEEVRREGKEVQDAETEGKRAVWGEKKEGGTRGEGEGRRIRRRRGEREGSREVKS